MTRPPRDIESLFGPDNLAAIDAAIDDSLKDSSTSAWLRHALGEALKRDPVDAVNDAEILLELLTLRMNAVILGHGSVQFDNREPDEGR